MIPCELPPTEPTVLFDVDGTLLSLRGAGKRALDRAITDVWGLENALEGVSFAGATDNHLAEILGPGRDVERLWPRYLEELAVELDRYDDPKPLDGVPALLDALTEEQLPIGLLTGNLRAGARLKLQAVKLWQRFDLAISAFGDEGPRRNDIAALARHRAGPGAIVIVGDSVADAVAARHIGARVLLTATGPQAKGELEATEPDRLVDDLSDTGGLLGWITGG